MFSNPQVVIAVCGVVFIGLAVIINAIQKRNDSLAKIAVDMAKTQKRISNLSVRKLGSVNNGLQEIKNLEDHLRETKGRVTKNNIKHQDVINKADNLFNALNSAMDTTETTKGNIKN